MKGTFALSLIVLLPIPPLVPTAADTAIDRHALVMRHNIE
jgi:hypothetical protein